MQTIRWGIIGCGDVTEIKSGPGFQKAAGSTLTMVMRRDPAKAQDYAQRHNVPRWTTNADALIADKEVDAVYIATPPGTHEHYAMKVLAAGKPCYVEKPMTRNAAEARRMVDAFARARIPLFVAYYRRALPRFLKVKELVDSGAIGDLRQVDYTYADGQMLKPAPQPLPWRFDPEHSGGGLFLDLASHVLDLLDFYLGPLSCTEAHAGKRAAGFRVEDEVTAAFKSLSGTPAMMEFDFMSHQPADTFTFIGNEATLQIPCFGKGNLRLIRNNGAVEEFDVPYPPHVAQPMIQTITDELRGAGQCPSRGENGLRAQQMIDAVLNDYYQGREDGFWNRLQSKI